MSTGDRAEGLGRLATVTIDAADPASPGARRALGCYFAELAERFDFDASAPGTTDLSPLRPPAGTFLLARSGGQPVACGGVQTLGPGVGEIKRMWVAAAWRGAGLGSRLLGQLEERARSLGHDVVRLDTNAALTEAIALYERRGYRHIPRYNDNPSATHFFEKPLGAAPR